jgi:signal transduction histidine kinase/ligand-binding sensor domain-containing protein
LPDDEVSALHVGRDGVVWIGTRRGGVARVEGERIVALRHQPGTPDPFVVGFSEDADGTLWVNLPDRFETIARGDSVVRPRAARLATAQRMVLAEHDGTRWFSTADGLLRVRGDSTRAFRRSEGTPPRAGMVADPGGGYWLGTANDGLFFFRPGDADRLVRHYALPDGRQKYSVRSSFVDRDGNVWVGTNANGLLRARRNVVTVYSAENGLSHDVATAVFGAADGTMWIGTNCGGLNAVDLLRRTVRTFKPRKPNDPTGDPCLFALTEGPEGVMWAGTWGGGVTRLDAGREERLGRGALGDSVILALFTDRDGTVWAGTNSGGLAALAGGRVRSRYTTADGLAHNSVRTIYQTRDGALWIGTLGGLSRFVNGRFTTIDAAKGLSAPHVRSIHEDVDGALWIGTYGGGLNRLLGDRITVIRQRDGLADDVVSSILEDGAGRLWMSGNRGIWRVERADLVAFAMGRARGVHSVLYGSGDGLDVAETNGGFQPAAWKDALGRLWFPTVHGVAMIDPARIGGRAVEPPPAVSIEHVVMDGQERPHDGASVVAAGRPNLEFRYAGLSLSGPEHVTYRYRLEGYDDDWVEVGGRRVAYYSRVPPGQYRFVVSAANREGVWNAEGTALSVRVTGPLWSYTWFQILAGVALLGAIVVAARRRAQTARRWRVAQEAFSRRLIESQEHERKRVAGELHDGLGQELLVIKNRALLALRAERPETAREQLDHITTVAGQALETVRGLAHRLTPYQLDHLGLSAALRAMVEHAAESVEIAFTVGIDDIDGLLPMEGQINLYRIVQEAVTNVVRHSGARSASVRARHDQGRIVVTVRDDGRGFIVSRDHAGNPAGGFGISGIVERARILAGRVDVVSAPGQGTRVELAVPIAPSPVALPPGTLTPGTASPPATASAREP